MTAEFRLGDDELSEAYLEAAERLLPDPDSIKASTTPDPLLAIAFALVGLGHQTRMGSLSTRGVANALDRVNEGLGRHTQALHDTRS